MDYLVIDAGFKQGKDRNLLFATNDKHEAIKVAKDSGSGVVVINQNEKDKSEEIIFIYSLIKSGETSNLLCLLSESLAVKS